MNIISFDIKVNDKVVATFSMNAGETTVNITEPAELVQNNIGIEQIDWHKVKEFVEENDITLLEQESGVLNFYLATRSLTNKQALVLDYVLKKVKQHGFTPDYLF